VDRPNLGVRLTPHERLSHAERWRLAQEFARPALLATAQQTGGDLPSNWGFFDCQPADVAMTALYRESEDAGAGCRGYAGTGMAFPFVLRLVELDGAACVAQVTVPGPLAAAHRTNLPGESEGALAATLLPTGRGPVSQLCRLEVPLRPHAVASIYLDLLPGRKQARCLDERRSVWASAHRVRQGEDT
jgi:hypothetical protein